MLLLTLRGTPTLYYGDEIGMRRRADPARASAGPAGSSDEPGHRPRPGAHADAVGRGAPTPASPRGDALAAARPMTATATSSAQRDDPGSMLTLYRRLLALRREQSALAIGSYRTVPTEPDAVFAYERSQADMTIRVILNFGDAAQVLPLPEGVAWTVLLSSHAGRTGERLSGRSRWRAPRG